MEEEAEEEEDDDEAVATLLVTTEENKLGGVAGGEISSGRQTSMRINLDFLLTGMALLLGKYVMVGYYKERKKRKRKCVIVL